MPTLSGYTTSRNCFKGDYPIKEVIGSLLEFCDEVVVADSSNKEDDTLEYLLEYASREPRLKVKHFDDIDWSYVYHGVYDGLMKARARALCSSEFLFQSDMDEIVHPDDYEKVRNIINHFPQELSLIALPVIDYWGSDGKVRVDVPSWKWRISRNVSVITHGIPKSLRRYDEQKRLFAAHGTDGCNYIHSITGEEIPFGNFVSNDSERLRHSAIRNGAHATHYQGWFQHILDNLPATHHFSWFSLTRKTRSYKNFWSGFWKSLYNEDVNKPNPMFGDLPPDEITEELICKTAAELNTIGGWVFHSPWDKKTFTNHIRVSQSFPPIMTQWMERNRDKFNA